MPSWADVERNLEQKFSELNQGVNESLQSAHDNWNGFTRRVGNGASQAYGCLSILQEGITTAWHADDGVKSAGLDPSGGSASIVQERTERAARQLARGQEQLVLLLLLLTAIVTCLTRGQMKAGVVGSMESIATRSARLQAEISNKQLAGWLARNEQKLLAQAELQVKKPTPLAKAETETMREYYAKQDPEFVTPPNQIAH